MFLSIHTSHVVVTEYVGDGVCAEGNFGITLTQMSGIVRCLDFGHYVGFCDL